MDCAASRLLLVLLIFKVSLADPSDDEWSSIPSLPRARASSVSDTHAAAIDAEVARRSIQERSSLNLLDAVKTGGITGLWNHIVYYQSGSDYHQGGPSILTSILASLLVTAMVSVLVSLVCMICCWGAPNSYCVSPCCFPLFSQTTVYSSGPVVYRHGFGGTAYNGSLVGPASSSSSSQCGRNPGCDYSVSTAHGPISIPVARV
eukprot:TRINITY_DN65162_c0_g1_i1.p1 TRINITY_DN65162_c0_g1~~TRINITY_DN65162_c0_g1_i1.p1  ORF type:complete len:204 (-),score=13.48 TRINITY_DN65162_c0_g1_i1:238-849(-)